MQQELSVLDLEFGISQLSGNRDLFVKLLGKFKAEYLNAQNTLAQYVTDNNVKQAKNMVHTIKGVAGNLGMNKLHALCKELEQNLQTDDITSVNTDAFCEVLAESFEKINELEVGSDSPAPSEQSAQLQKNALLKALQKNEFIPGNKLDAMLENVNLPADKKEALVDAINDLDYASALELLGS